MRGLYLTARACLHILLILYTDLSFVGEFQCLHIVLGSGYCHGNVSKEPWYVKFEGRDLWEMIADEESAFERVLHCIRESQNSDTQVHKPRKWNGPNNLI